MPTKFSDFFTPAPDADDFQKRLYDAISDATTIVECYYNIYVYIIAGVKWVSRQTRHDSMDNTVDLTGLDKQQMDDAAQYFGDLTEPGTAVLFEQLDIFPQDSARYGSNVYNLEFKAATTAAARAAYRQVQFYLRVKIYNDEYDRQDAYHKANLLTTTPPPNGKITINPATPLDPDKQAQLDHLKTAVDQLETWMKANYPVLKAVVNAKAGQLFSLVFDSGVLPDEHVIEALDTMVERVRCSGDSRPNSTHKQFGLWVLGRLEAHADFWNQTKISGAYASAIDLKPKFQASARKTLKVYQFFQKLFADFLSLSRYQGESEADAKTRRTTAFGYIKTIFEGFVSTNSEVTARYAKMMEVAFGRIQSDYEDLYTANLLRAREAIPASGDVKTTLPNYLADVLKEKADECLRTLPLLRGNIDVRFFTIQNFEELQALNDKSVIIRKADQLKSSVVVPSDPSENDVDKYRPIYRGIRYSNTTHRYVAFCNMPNLAPGTFYYRHVTSPAVVDAPATNVSGRTLTIDFQNYTINYPRKKDRTRNDAGEPYRAFGSTTRFFADLKSNTKWTAIAGVRRYDPYYITNPADVSKPFAHLTGFVAAGRGATRTLPLGDDSFCLWWWNCSSAWARARYPRMGEIIGLPAERSVVPLGAPGLAQLQILDTPHAVQIGGATCSLVNYGLFQFRSNGFFYQIIGVTWPGKPEQFYVQVNTPGPSVAAILTGHKEPNSRRASRPLDDKPQTILDRFNFSYFRRITNTIDKTTQQTNFSENSKVIQLFKKGDRRKPTGPGIEVLQCDSVEFDAVGTNLPICFNIAENIVRYYLDKQTRGKIINKGNTLFRERKPRKDAATAMRPMHGMLRAPLSTTLSASKIPATAFANGVMRQSAAAQQDWGVLKVASCNYMPVNQEWCHLRGHGDGGEEYPGNFVSGSLHCNTEQLAVETGQRLVTQQEQERSYLLHTTAYLLRDAKDYKSPTDADRDSEILTGNYLDNQNTYQDMLDSNTARRSREQGLPDGGAPKKARTASGVQQPRPRQGDVAPLAAYLRYKVMRSDQPGGKSGKKRSRTQADATRQKYFDFIFEGQSEFIDVHQFTIISLAVQYALAGADAFGTWYEQAEAELDAKATAT